MSYKSNCMILNGKNIGISKIELDKDRLFVADKFNKYNFIVTVSYNWRDINTINIGEQKEISFNEYILYENNEYSLLGNNNGALIWPSKCYIKKNTKDELYLYFDFEDLTKESCFMNKRGCFDIELKSLEVKVFINCKDVKGDSIVYEF